MTEKQEILIKRPPVVVVMGHIDHGKSTLLDFIRKTNIVEKEAGGITQHIGAYEAVFKDNKITFLDTPGHEVFSQMRLRGAHIADIAILIVAADEGVKPQTLEAYESIKKANIPFAIAINKIDKKNADPERVKKQLSEKNIFVEGYGGNIPVVNISAKTGEGVEELLDMVLLLAEMENLLGDPNKNAEGFIVESTLDHKKGISATLLILDGTLKRGMFVVTEDAISPAKIIEDFYGNSIDEATFSSPVKITGFNKLPRAGLTFKSFNTKREAEKEAEHFRQINIEKECLREDIKDDKGICLPVVIKTDVLGSLEALENEVNKLSKEKIKIKVIRTGVGNINEDDVKFASSATNSLILGFNVETNSSAKELAKRFKIEIFSSNIIYKITEWLEERIKEIESKNENEKEKILGVAKILKKFSQTKTKKVLGGRVILGKIIEGKKIKIKRNEEEIGEGKILELQKNKTPVKEVNEQEEFGVMVETKTELMEGDELVII